MTDTRLAHALFEGANEALRQAQTAISKTTHGIRSNIPAGVENALSHAEVAKKLIDQAIGALKEK
jgi:hypothetical protein